MSILVIASTLLVAPLHLYFMVLGMTLPARVAVTAWQLG